MRDTQHTGHHRIRVRSRALVAAVAVSSVAAGAAIVGAAVDVDATGSSLVDGLTPADAAASCWEVKQQHPDSADGVYWLRNGSLERPEQFYCDMTTDGGGWVMVGRGREGWTFRDDGQSTAQQLREVTDGAEAFAPAALSSETIDALLDGGAVKDLADGLRIRRATNEDGTRWQDLRWQFLDLGAWSWGFGGGHRLAGFSIDGVVGTGSNSKDSGMTLPGEVGAGNRNGYNLNGWFTYPWSGHGRQAGFSYRGTVDGRSDDSSYLWEYRTEQRAIPFTQLFLRPRITTPELAPIADSGLAEVTLTPMVDDRPAVLASGVRGVAKIGDSEPALDTPVLAITTLGDRVYVGGKFAQVRDASTGDLVDHRFLAAFDRATGAWIPSFRPQLDGTVYDLDVASGRPTVRPRCR